MPETQTTPKLQTLAEHQELLRQVFSTATEKILILSPYINITAIKSDDILSLTRQAVERGVEVQIFVDSNSNCYSDGTMKNHAADAVVELVEAGARVAVVNGLRSKAIARDNDLITQGSFNWLSAVKIRSGELQLKESTQLHTGENVPTIIAREMTQIEEAGYGYASVDETDDSGITKAGKIVGGIFVLVMPTLIGNDLGNRNAGIICTAVILAVLALYSYLKSYQTRKPASTQQA